MWFLCGGLATHLEGLDLRVVGLEHVIVVLLGSLGGRGLQSEGS